MLQLLRSRGHRAAKLSIADNVLFGAVSPAALVETLANTAIDILEVNTEMVG